MAQIITINRSDLEFGYGEIFTLEDLIAFDDDTEDYRKQDASIAYAINRICEDGDYIPLVIDSDHELKDGYHRIAAIAFLANKYPERFNFDQINVIIEDEQ